MLQNSNNAIFNNDDYCYHEGIGLHSSVISYSNRALPPIPCTHNAWFYNTGHLYTVLLILCCTQIDD